MGKLFHKIYYYLMRMESKIAFYPSLIAVFGTLFALGMIYAEQKGVSTYFQKILPVLVINNIETVRTILSTFIGGLISILVFSFSMVMILLNQASSNFSPRLLPGLISNKKHQSILGIYLGCIFYCLIVLISIEPEDIEYQLPGFSVLIAIVFMTVSLGAFIYFIHSISQSIQVDQILKSVFERAKTRLNNLIEIEESYSGDQFEATFKDSDEWFEYYIEESGYIQTVDEKGMLTLLQENDTKIDILPRKNTFLLKGRPVFRSKKELDDKKVQEFLDQIIVDDSEPLSDNFALSFQLITEIGIKAMSPGINDPGTALTCIDYLTELLALRMKKDDTLFLYKDETIYVRYNITSFEDMIHAIFAPFRTYCAHDILIVQKILKMCEYLIDQPCDNRQYKAALKKEMIYLISDAKNEISNDKDVQRLEYFENKWLD